MGGTADLTSEGIAAQVPRDETSSPEVSIIMPCLNEAETLEACVGKARRFLCEHRIAGEIIVADNGSTDGSQAIAARMGARTVHVGSRGYGRAIMGGVAAARGKFVIMGDADDSYDFTGLLPFVTRLREGYDLVMGNRFKSGIRAAAMPFLHRYVGNPFLTRIGRLFFHSVSGDFHCGLRGFSRAAFLRMNLRTTGMEFASEMIVKATLLGMRITEVPTTLSPSGRTRPSHLRPWRDGWRHLRFMLLYSPRWLFLYPGLLLMLIGALTGVWLLPGPRAVGTVTFDVHTLLYAAAAILLGFEAISFAALSRIFAVSEGLLPEDPRLSRFIRIITLEAGLVIGGVLVIIGLAGSLYAFSAWGARHYGPLDSTKTLRMVIPAIVSLTLGCQIVLSSFFLSVVGMGRR